MIDAEINLKATQFNMVKKHGIMEQDTNDIHILNLERLGFSIFKGLIPETKVNAIKKVMHEVYEKQAQEVGGVGNLKKIKDDGIIRALFSYDELFLEPVYDLFINRAKNANETNCKLVLSFLSQFFHRRRHFSSHAKERSTTHR